MQSCARSNLNIVFMLRSKAVLKFGLCLQGSGSNIDLCVITREGTQYLRPYEIANDKGVRQGKYTYKRGTTGK